MKKTLLALAVIAASSSVAANEIYSTDTTKFSLSGEIDAYLTTSEVDKIASDVVTTTKKDPDITTWAKIQIDAEHKLTNTLTAFASFEIESDGSSSKFDDAYLGIKTDTWGIAAGEVGDLADSMDAIQKDDITNEGNYMGSTGGHSTEGKGNGFVFKAEVVDGLVIVADVNTEEEESVDNIFGISANYAFSNYSLGASYVAGEVNGGDDDTPAYAVDHFIAGISLSAEFGDLYLAASYADFEGVNDFAYWTEDFLSGTTAGVAASYQLNKTRLYATYAFAEMDEETFSGTSVDIEVTNLVVGADYAVLDNILVFAEYQVAELDNSVETLDAYTVMAGVYYSF